MKNLEKLLVQVEKISRSIEKTRETIALLRLQKKDLVADLSEMDLHYDLEDRAMLLELVAVIQTRRAEIEEFEQETGLVFDVAIMELPPGNLLAWWKAAVDSDPEIATLWAGR